MVATTRIEHGAVLIPAELRERLGLEDGTLLVVEGDDAGLYLRRAYPEPEVYSPERIAEFLLNNAITAEDYENAVKEVRRLGIDPASIPHDPPPR
ncbi:MAG TPA: AbrB/MazE/SpoVT family DNA-binding domain-containing protein [Thermomicrobiales bacterium]|nr:AbrB/MazE/SpoVT family DNA-binding domain-containing protein [Thermomicrobiales bacterium]